MASPHVGWLVVLMGSSDAAGGRQDDRTQVHRCTGLHCELLPTKNYAGFNMITTMAALVAATGAHKLHAWSSETLTLPQDMFD
jgi:hypothetical protein